MKLPHRSLCTQCPNCIRVERTSMLRFLYWENSIFPKYLEWHGFTLFSLTKLWLFSLFPFLYFRILLLSPLFELHGILSASIMVYTLASERQFYVWHSLGKKSIVEAYCSRSVVKPEYSQRNGTQMEICFVLCINCYQLLFFIYIYVIALCYYRLVCFIYFCKL